ncbi:MAG: hypothetical protein CMM49_08380 [Rhodospirillaceae bacterium]|nr:hypothetical protein [Rhodospirillaceae bacterium]|tara:strand:+ start:1659 stop:1910 length:252 start_codon:yes stop_codon:yes gene_type:complete
MDNINSIQHVTDLIREASSQSKKEKQESGKVSENPILHQDKSNIAKKTISNSPMNNQEKKENIELSKSKINKNPLGSHLDLVI